MQWRSRSWSELSRGQRAGVGAVAAVQVALQVGALVDLRRRPAKRVRGSKALWTLASFLNFVGPLAYFRFGRLH